MSLIADLALRKVVLARSLTIELPAPPDVEALHDAFATLNPRGYTYTVRESSGAVWVGSSPELLLRKQGNHLSSQPMAGSRPKVVAAEVDAKVHRALTTSEKDHAEHFLVVDEIVGILRQHTDSLQVPGHPTVVGTDSMWHLATPIEGETSSPLSSYELAALLHPTPAVGGVPREAALAFIADAEAHPRGLYGGFVGWQDAAGDGEWAVAIRCLRLDGTTLTIPAGAGIVAGSQPNAEQRETESKCGTALAALRRLGVDIHLAEPAIPLLDNALHRTKS